MGELQQTTMQEGLPGGSEPAPPGRTVGPGENSFMFDDAKAITEVPENFDGDTGEMKESSKQLATQQLKQVSNKQGVENEQLSPLLVD